MDLFIISLHGASLYVYNTRTFVDIGDQLSFHNLLISGICLEQYRLFFTNEIKS
jgi:hypothetical protein